MDDVSERGASARATQSDHQDKKNECAQCAESGRVVSAAGFCRTCNDFLCTACIERHKILRGLKHHELLESELMLNSEPVVSQIEKCSLHPARPIEAYCKDEDTFGCLECFTVEHRLCKNVGLISDLSQAVDSSKDFLDIQQTADRCKIVEEQYRKAIQTSMSMNEVWHKKTLEDFQKFRATILSMIDEIEEKLSKEADKLKEENEKVLTDLAQQIAAYSDQVKRFLLKLDDMKASKKNEQLFITLKKTGRDVIDSVSCMEKLHQYIEIKTFNFNSDHSVTTSLSKNTKVNVELTPFPDILCTKAVEKKTRTIIQTTSSPAIICTSVSTIKIKSREDTRVCLITGIVELSSTQLLLSDWNNSCLKLLDLTSSTIIKRRALTQPWDVTKFPKDRVAVSLPFIKQIQIFRADQSLDLCMSIPVTGECRGLYCTGDQIVVSFTSPVVQVQILDLTGNVLLSIQHDALFKRPLFLAVSPDNMLIYVSDCENDVITCMDMTGAVQWVYQDQELNSSRGTSTGGGGCIYACSWNTNTIHVISSYGSRLVAIPNSQSRVKLPCAVCYSSYHRTLYVSSTSDGKSNHCNYINILNLQQPKDIDCGSIWV